MKPESQWPNPSARSITPWVHMVKFPGEAERVEATVEYSSIPNHRTITATQTIGISVVLVPWNFPVAMILRKASAALAVGCTTMIK
jgi:acyl-CoA reductase-like NAD-dependent aldehyde dehydrogenase